MFITKKRAEECLRQYGMLLYQRNIFEDAAVEWMMLYDDLKNKYEPDTINEVEYSKGKVKAKLIRKTINQ